MTLNEDRKKIPSEYDVASVSIGYIFSHVLFL